MRTITLWIQRALFTFALPFLLLFGVWWSLAVHPHRPWVGWKEFLVILLDGWKSCPGEW